MGYVARPFGVFENFPLDDVRNILQRFDYVDLASIAATNDSMKAFIKEEVTTNGFLTRWTARQSVVEQETDCHVGIAKLILTTFGGGAETEKEEDERVETWRKFLDAAYMQTRTFATAGCMMKAFLEAHTTITNRLVGKVFECVWTLGNRYLDWAAVELTTHLSIVNTFEALNEEDFAEDEWKKRKEESDESQKHIYLVHRSVRDAFFIETSSPTLRRLLVSAVYNRLGRSHIYECDTEQFASFLLVVLGEVYPGTEVVNKHYFGLLSVYDARGLDEYKRLAGVFTDLMDGATRCTEDFDQLADVFRRTTRFPTEWPMVARSALLAVEPRLFHLYLNDHGVHTSASGITVFTALLMMHEWHHADDAKYAAFVDAIERVRHAHDEQHDGDEVLAKLCLMVLRNAQSHDQYVEVTGGSYNPCHNRFYITFFELIQ